MSKIVALLLVIYFSTQGCSTSPKPIKLPCSLSTLEFNNRIQDTLQLYHYQVLKADSNSIESIRKIDDGMSIRTIYLSLNKDTTSAEWMMVVRTLVRFQGEVNEFYLDEQPRLTNDFRSDFKPVLRAIRLMCEPPPKKKKKK